MLDAGASLEEVLAFLADPAMQAALEDITRATHIGLSLRAAKARRTAIRALETLTKAAEEPTQTLRSAGLLLRATSARLVPQPNAVPKDDLSLALAQALSPRSQSPRTLAPGASMPRASMPARSSSLHSPGPSSAPRPAATPSPTPAPTSPLHRAQPTPGLSVAMPPFASRPDPLARFAARKARSKKDSG